MTKYGRVRLRKARFGDMRANCRVAMLGKSGTGKSSTIKFVLSKTKIRRVVVFGGNKDAMASWEDQVDALYIHPADTQKLQDIRDYQDRLLERLRKRYKKVHGTTKGFKAPLWAQIIILIDDCGEDPMMKSQLMRDLSINVTHFGITLYLLLQHFHQIPPGCRKQIDYLGLLPSEHADDSKKIWKEYLSKTVPDLKKWNRIFDSCTETRGHICWIDNTSMPGSPDKISWYPIPHPDSMNYTIVGSRNVRRYAHVHSRENYNLDDDDKRLIASHTKDYGDFVVEREIAEGSEENLPNASRYLRSSKRQRKRSFESETETTYASQSGYHSSRSGWSRSGRSSRIGRSGRSGRRQSYQRSRRDRYNRRNRNNDRYGRIAEETFG